MAESLPRNAVNIGDTADLYAYLFENNEPVEADSLVSVQFIIERPDKTRETVEGEIQDDGAGFILYDNTDLPGEYRVVAQFAIDTGQIKSTISDFKVFDPFSDSTPDEDQLISGLVWDKLEDLFDSTDGGPWMRDMTLNIFNQGKIPDFMDEALLEINVYNPPTEFDVPVFVHTVRDDDGLVISTSSNSDTQILVLCTFLAVVRHLMRTYVEQPLPSGGQITYEDRRDYLQRWGTVYQIESLRFDGLLKLWKRRFLDLNKGKVLVSSKAGRLSPAPLRTRNIGRGYYTIAMWPALLLLLHQLINNG